MILFRNEEILFFYFVSIDSHPASSSTAHLSSSKLIRLGAGSSSLGFGGVLFVVVVVVFFVDEDFVVVVVLDGLVLGLSLSHESKFKS